jgi:ubiquinone/menaquinone biosynthesis C-methylase UbiE
MNATIKGHKGIGMDGWMARWYAKNTARLMHEFTADARRVAALLAPGAALLEVAPGPGYFAVELAKLGAYEITGLDISATCVELARSNAARAGVRADFLQGDASSMPFAADRFDFVFCRAAFKNFAAPARALDEMHRVLKPGGRALIVDLRSDAPLATIDAEVASMGLGFWSTLATRLIFRRMLLPRAYSKAAFAKLVAATQLHLDGIEERGMGMDIWLSKIV